MIELYVTALNALVMLTTDLTQASQARLVFEAMPEVESLKLTTLRRLHELCDQDTWFLSNTSSIPIEALDSGASLRGRIVGFHFYNPPPVQKLLELIPATSTLPALVTLAEQIAQRLGKTVVFSRDVAGFIGNGQFIRECLYALSMARESCEKSAHTEAMYAVNKASADGLLRPMGIFQVMDYAGL